MEGLTHAFKQLTAKPLSLHLFADLEGPVVLLFYSIVKTVGGGRRILDRDNFVVLERTVLSELNAKVLVEALTPVKTPTCRMSVLMTDGASNFYVPFFVDGTTCGLDSARGYTLAMGKRDIHSVKVRIVMDGLTAPTPTAAATPAPKSPVEPSSPEMDTDEMRQRIDEWALDRGQPKDVRILLSSLQTVAPTLWPEHVELNDLLSEPALKKQYRKAILVFHPDKTANDKSAELIFHYLHHAFAARENINEG